jgi:hypothetical protein
MERYGHGVTGWFKSSFCGSGGSDCVEVALLGADGDGGCGGIALRDSKDKAGPVLRFTPAQWLAFVAGARSGEFDPR